MSEQVWKEQAIHLMALLDQEKRTCAALSEENERLRKALENAAIVAECHSDDRPGRDRPFDWNDGYIDGCRGAAAAIRAAMEAKP